MQYIKDLFDPKKRKPKVPMKDVSIFVRQLATMLEAGIPLHAAITYLSKSADNRDLRTILTTIGDRVASGTTFSWALKDYPKIFSDVMSALVETGEMTGMLTSVLSRVADLMEKQLEMHQKLVSTLTYPLVLVTMSGLSMGVFVFFVLPTTVPLFASLNIPLPWPTKVLLWSRVGIPVILSILGALFLLNKIFKGPVEDYLRSHPLAMEFVQRIPMRIPGFGVLYTKMMVARILFSMASMIENGVTLLAAVKRSAATSSNQYVVQRMKIAEQELRDGEMLAAALKRTEIFPRTALYLIAVGEETSRLNEMLQHSANIFEEEVDLELAKFSALVEPLIMMVMGIVVGFIVISSLLPMLKLIQSL